MTMVVVMILLIIILLSAAILSEFCLDWLTKQARWAHLARSGSKCPHGSRARGKIAGANSLKSSSFLDSVGVEFQKQLKTVKMKKT